MQDNILDKLRPISLAITHEIKSVPPRRHSGAKKLEKLAPVLSVSPSNTLHSEVCNKRKLKYFTVLIHLNGPHLHVD